MKCNLAIDSSKSLLTTPVQLQTFNETQNFNKCKIRTCVLSWLRLCIKAPQATRLALGGSGSGSGSSAMTEPLPMQPSSSLSMNGDADQPSQATLSPQVLGQSSSGRGSGETSTFRSGPGESDTPLAPSPTPTVILTPTRTSASISSFVTRISSQRLKALQAMMARAIYTSGSPFRLVENEDWAAFLSELNPSFKMPSRADVGGRLLDGEAGKVEQAQTARLAQGDRPSHAESNPNLRCLGECQWRWRTQFHTLIIRRALNGEQ